jgi:hypothetical protein
MKTLRDNAGFLNFQYLYDFNSAYSLIKEKILIDINAKRPCVSEPFCLPKPKPMRRITLLCVI